MAVNIKTRLTLRVNSKYAKGQTDLLEHFIDIPYAIDIIDEDGDDIPEEVSIAKFFIRNFLLPLYLKEDGSLKETLKTEGIHSYKEVVGVEFVGITKLTADEQSKLEETRKLIIFSDLESITGVEIDKMKSRDLMFLLSQLDIETDERMYRTIYNKENPEIQIDEELFNQTDLTTLISSVRDEIVNGNLVATRNFIKTILNINEFKETKSLRSKNRRAKSTIDNTVEESKPTRGVRNARKDS